MTTTAAAHPRASEPPIRQTEAALSLLSRMAADYARIGDDRAAQAMRHCADRKVRALLDHKSSVPVFAGERFVPR